VRFFKLKDPKTGLYYCPSREIKVNVISSRGEKVSRYVKSNLSKRGKVYSTSQPLEKQIYDHTLCEKQDDIRSYSRPPLRNVNFEVETVVSDY
jgi:hypothetical protein